MHPVSSDYLRQSFASTPGLAFAGLRIIVSDKLERPVIGTAVEPRFAERWFAWVLRLFGVDPFAMWVSRGPIYGPAPFYRMGDTIICAPEAVEALRSLNH